ncbi:MAG: HAMP domain-containing histidine kinase, partial [Chrysiogenales bacterium]
FETGTIKKNFSETDFIGDIANPAIETIEPQLQEKGMTLGRNYKENIDTVICDPALIKIVIVNLLGNAVKYGREKGAIQITISREEQSISCAIWNEGPGFPEKERKKLFRKFSRLESPELMKRKGTGIGLYTSWKIIKLHDGRIWGKSEEGKWAEFGFNIPTKNS